MRKKTIGVAFVLLFAVLHVWADTPGIIVDGLEYRQGDVIAAAGEIVLQRPSDFAGTVPMMALWGADGRLMQVELGSWQQTGANCRSSFVLPPDIKDAEAVFYFWKSMTGVQPYCAPWHFIVDNTVPESVGNYSDVYVSSRWYRPDGKDGQWGTLDALKRFMATGEKWGYITNTNEIANIKNMGLTFQNAVNINIGDDTATRAELFDGTLAQAPWMTWGAKWSCVNKQAYRDMVWRQLRTSIDNGVTEIQFDDWAANVSAVSWGACFCTDCMRGFRVYLQDALTAEQLADFGIADIGTFDYKQFLREKYDIQTNEAYLQIMRSEPLYPYFLEFHLQSTREFHRQTKQMMTQYALQPMHYDHNVFNFGSGFADRMRVFAYDIFDGGIGETKTAGMALPAVVASGYLSRGVSKPFIYSPIPEEDNFPLIRQTAALCYATGQHMLVPWDTWLHDDVRYFATVEEIGDLFHFVRQYPALFDGFEIPAKVGLLVNLDECTPAGLQAGAMRLFAEGIPFRMVVSKQEIPYFTFSKEDLNGLEYLIEGTPADGLREQEQQAIAQSGISLTDFQMLPAGLRAADTNHREVYTVLREKDDARVVHLLNRTGEAVGNLQVTIYDSALYDKKTQVILYAPGRNPQRLETQQTAEGLWVTIDCLQEWGILQLLPEAATSIPDDGWSGMSIGTRTTPSDTASMQAGRAEIISHGFGLGGETAGDTPGTQDRVGFVYQDMGRQTYRNATVRAHLQQADGAAGVMVREYPSSNARFVAAEAVPDGIRLVWRDADNAPVQSQVFAEPVGDWIQLDFDAEDGSYSASVSSDGARWTPLPQRVPLRLVRQLAGVYGAGVSGKSGRAVWTDIALQRGAYAPNAWPTAVMVSAPERMEATETAALSAVITTAAAGDLPQEQFDMSYQSNAPDVLQVDGSGAITAVAPGSAVVTVTAQAGEHRASQTVRIEVSPRNLSLLEEGFEGTELPNGWIFGSNTANGGYARIEQETGRGGVLSIFDNVVSDNISGVCQLRKPAAETIVAEMDFKTVSQPASARKGAIVFYTYDTGGNFATSLLTGANYFYTMENGVQTKICDMKEGVWYHIKMELRLPDCRQVITISDDSGIAAQKEYDFRNRVTELAKVSVGGNVDAVGTYAYWDNLSVRLKD